jgi:hypothetical protein
MSHSFPYATAHAVRQPAPQRGPLARGEPLAKCAPPAPVILKPMGVIAVADGTAGGRTCVGCGWRPVKSASAAHVLLPTRSSTRRPWGGGRPPAPPLAHAGGKASCLRGDSGAAGSAPASMSRSGGICHSPRAPEEHGASRRQLQATAAAALRAGTPSGCSYCGCGLSGCSSTECLAQDGGLACWHTTLAVLTERAHVAHTVA